MQWDVYDAGIALRVPTPNVSVVDLVIQTEKKTFAEEVNEAFREYSKAKGKVTPPPLSLVASTYMINIQLIPKMDCWWLLYGRTTAHVVYSCGVMLREQVMNDGQIMQLCQGLAHRLYETACMAVAGLPGSL